MENKSLKKGVDQLPFPQHYNADVGEYETVQGKNGASFIEVRNEAPIDVRIEETGIIIPIDIKGLEKTPLYNHSSTTEPALKLLEVPAFDFINKKELLGIITCDTEVTLYIQESSNQGEWFTTYKETIEPSTQELFGTVQCYEAKPFSYTPKTRYVRVLVRFGETVSNKFNINLFSNTL